MIVLDASALLELLLNDRLAARVADRVFDPAESLHAPHLIDVEVAQVLRRLVRRNETTPERCGQALDDLLQFPMSRYPHSLLLPRVWSLCDNATAHDATYLALAEALDATLLTCDAALASIPGHCAQVEVVH